MMDKLSNSEAALLALLSEEPMYPYQIEQQVKYRDMRFWTDLSMSSIYKLLQKLEDRGYILRTDEISAENRLRKLYSVSDEGTKALGTKLVSLLSEPEHVRWQVDIGTYNCDLLPVKTVQRSLKAYRRGLEKNIEDYTALRKFLEDSGCPVHRHALASRAIFLLKGEIEWVDSFLEQIGQDE